MNPVGKAGYNSPLGATVVDGGVNFSLFSRSATGVELLLFDREDDARPARVLRLDPATNRTYHYWHVGVPGVQPGQLYGYSVAGPSDCQDNETSWFDWTLLAQHADVHRFVTLLNARRLLRDVEHEHQRVSLNQWLRGVNKAWHGVTLNQPDWRTCSHSLAVSAEFQRERLRIYLILNAYWEPLDFELPPVDQAGDNPWRRWIDTALEAPHDIVPWQNAPMVSGSTYRAEARAVVVLFASG